jgi:hypothetical protein
MWYFVRIVTGARNLTKQVFLYFVNYCCLDISYTLKKVTAVSRSFPLTANYRHISVHIIWVPAVRTNRTLKVILITFRKQVKPVASEHLNPFQSRDAFGIILLILFFICYCFGGLERVNPFQPKNCSLWRTELKVWYNMASLGWKGLKRFHKHHLLLPHFHLIFIFQY